MQAAASEQDRKQLTISMHEASVGVFTGVDLAKKNFLGVPAQIREKWARQTALRMCGQIRNRGPLKSGAPL